MDSIGGKYKITGCIGQHGEYVAYFGVDIDTNMKVVIHEYSPLGLSTKNNDIMTCKCGSEVIYKSLMEDYIDLGSMLIDISYKGFSLPRHIDMIRQYNTVYAIIQYTQGETLEDFLARHNGAIGWTTLKRMITPVIDLLIQLHSKGYFHRGISPCNLLMSENQTLMLTGFCIASARTAQSEIESTLFASYAAPEQHMISSWQGAWTDIYSLAATCYRALTGVSVVDCRQRKTQPNLIAPSDYNKDIPIYVSNAIMHALTFNTEGRQSSIQELWNELNDDTIIPMPAETEPTYKKTSSDIVPILMGFVIMISVIMFIVEKMGDSVPIYEEISSSVSILDDQTSQADSEVSSHYPLVEDFTEKYIETLLTTEQYTQFYQFDIEWIYTENYTYGTVISQYPLANSPLKSNKMSLVVSKGSEFVVMPDILGRGQQTAMDMLTALGIPYTIMPIIDIGETPFTISSCSISPGQTLSRKSDFVILYSIRHQ